MKRLKWLRDIDIPCAVVVDQIHLCSQIEQHQTGRRSSEIEAHLPAHPTTLCGVHIRNCSDQSNSRPVCTLGGIILVEGIPFGLTVEHAFQPDVEDLNLHNDKEDRFTSSTLLCDDDESWESPFITFDDDSDNITSQVSVSSLPPYPVRSGAGATSPDREGQTASPESPNHRLDFEGVVYRRIGKALPSITRDGSAIHRSSDWSLVQLDDPSYFLLNQIKSPGQHVPAIVENVIPEDFQNEGYVDILVAGDGARSGWLMSSPALLKVGNTVMETRLIILESRLGEPSRNMFDGKA
jgi:hypothetical protein